MDGEYNDINSIEMLARYSECLVIRHYPQVSTDCQVMTLRIALNIMSSVVVTVVMMVALVLANYINYILYMVFIIFI